MLMRVMRIVWGLSLILMGCSAPSFSQFPKEPVSLKVQGMTELDGKSAVDVFKLRDQAVQSEPKLRGLLPSGYQAANSGMLAGIESGRSWEGIEGWATATDEDFSSRYLEGDSLASVAINNPFLLVGLRSNQFCMAQAAYLGKREEVWTSEWLPREITVAGPARKILCHYQWSPVCPTRMLMSSNPGEELLTLETSNAADFGFVTYRVAKDKCQGVEVSEAGKLRLCRQFYRATKLTRSRSAVGVNGLTIAKGAYVAVTPRSFPMKMVVYLYRGSPTSDKAEPDVIEEIVVDKK